MGGIKWAKNVLGGEKSNCTKLLAIVEAGLKFPPAFFNRIALLKARM